MSDIKIIDVNKDDPYLDEIIPLFVKLYDHMKDSGIIMPLVKDGEKKWRASLDNMVGGRFGVMKAALHEDKVIGFAHGLIRYAPDYLGALKVGYLTHIFVSPEFRGNDTGKILVESVETWFKSKNVHSFELQVLCDNTGGINFWENTGYKKELFQMRKVV